MRLISLVTVLAAMAGCATDDAPPGDDFLDLSSSSGLGGRGDGVTLHIEQTGRMIRTRVGEETKTVSLSSSTMALLRTQADAAQLPRLDPRYQDPQVADDIFYRVTAQLADGTFSVETDLEKNTPPNLGALVSHLRALSDPYR